MSFLFRKWYYLAGFFALMWGATMGASLTTGPMKSSDWAFEAGYAVFLGVLFVWYWFGVRKKGLIHLANMDGVLSYDPNTHELTLTATVPEAARETLIKQVFKPGARYRIDGESVGAVSRDA